MPSPRERYYRLANQNLTKLFQWLFSKPGLLPRLTSLSIAPALYVPAIADLAEAHSLSLQSLQMRDLYVSPENYKNIFHLFSPNRLILPREWINTQLTNLRSLGVEFGFRLGLLPTVKALSNFLLRLEERYEQDWTHFCQGWLRLLWFYPSVRPLVREAILLSERKREIWFHLSDYFDLFLSD